MRANPGATPAGRADRGLSVRLAWRRAVCRTDPARALAVAGARGPAEASAAPCAGLVRP